MLARMRVPISWRSFSTAAASMKETVSPKQYIVNVPTDQGYSKNYQQNLRFYPVSELITPNLTEAPVRVVSYNILAETLALRHHQLYQHIQPQYLSWDNRMKQLIPQLETLGSDFYCLQEVDNFSLLEQHLQLSGYQGLFKKRTSNRNQDGCAIFWKTNRFDHIGTTPIEFNRNSDATQNFDNVAICSFFQLKNNPKKIVCVVSTHLLFDPQRGDLKLGQTQYMLTSIQESIQNMMNDYPQASISTVLAGDMNSTPYSGVWELLRRGKLKLNLNDLPMWRRYISGQNVAYRKPQKVEITQSIESLLKLEAFDANEGNVSFQHDLQLGSAYENYSALHEKLFNHPIESPPSPLYANETYGEPRVTAMINGSNNAVDSIWFSKDSLDLYTLLELPQQNDLVSSSNGLPSLEHPSDHFVLNAEFLFKNTQNK